MNKLKFTEYMNPLLDTLRSLGGSGRSKEVIDVIVDLSGVTEEDLKPLTKAGIPKVYDCIHWARFYLAKAGFIEANTKRGIWTLTKKGQNSVLKEIDIDDIKRIVTGREKKSTQGKEDPEEILITSPDLLCVIKSLSPGGFERVCQRLLRECGFKSVVVTGKTGDGGIDGEGILELNPLMSFKTLFQCKRYSGSVGSSVIRDFRGAMQGRADKGIVITTGTFTREAQIEAIRDGVPPIELVDGQTLVSLFERVKLGVKEKVVYEVDEYFFNEFKD